MALTIEQLMALVESFEEMTTARVNRLTLTLGYESESGESITLAHSYSLEGIYPQKEVSTDTTETRECTMCHTPFVSIEGRNVCWNCDTEGESDE